MPLNKLDASKILDTVLMKLIINKNGEILGMSKAMKEAHPSMNHPFHISGVFEGVLLEKIQQIITGKYSGQAIVQKYMSGNFKFLDNKPASSFIIYQPESEKAVITIKKGADPVISHPFYENVFYDSSIPMVIVNEWGFITFTNGNFDKIFHYPSNAQYIHLKKFLCNLRPCESFDYINYIHLAKENGYAEVKMTYDLAGSVRYYNIIMQIDPDTEMYILKFVDITEHENAMERLVHSDQLSTTGEIAASIAHEVRNPMTTLQGFLQLLEHEVTGNAHKYVTVIQGEVKRMNEILNEMLTLSRPTADKVEIFSLTVLVEDVLVLLRPKALLDQINISNENQLTEPVLIKANPNRMKQVIVNLLKNAMEAMEPQGTLNVQILSEDESEAEIIISDTGTGMTEDMIKTIFRPFVSNKEGGTGLGLPFVKKTIEEYDGRISVNSEIGKGTEFHVTLPKVATSVFPIDAETFI